MESWKTGLQVLDVSILQNLKDSMKNNLANQQYPVSYHGVTYVNGTKCDINGKPRTAKVKVTQTYEVPQWLLTLCYTNQYGYSSS